MVALLRSHRLLRPIRARQWSMRIPLMRVLVMTRRMKMTRSA